MSFNGESDFPNLSQNPSTYRYLFITRSRDAFLLEEPGGHIFHLVKKFFQLLKQWFPEVLATRFKGRVVPEEFARLDLVVVLPPRPPGDLLGLLLEGLESILLRQPGPNVKVRIPRQKFRIELDGRRGPQEVITGGENRFETATRALMALLLLDEIQTEWVRGTSSRRVIPKRRVAYFVNRSGGPEDNVRRGRFLERSRTPVE